jgi:hypothetical protein
VPCGANDEQAPTQDVVALAKQYGRYSYRGVTALLHAAGLRSRFAPPTASNDETMMH